jgi:hypothetical protein
MAIGPRPARRRYDGHHVRFDNRLADAFDGRNKDAPRFFSVSTNAGFTVVEGLTDLVMQ